MNTTTTSPLEDCNPFLDSVLVKVVKTVAFLVLLIVALVGNSMIIAVTCRNRNLQTTIHFFILNMAISDVLIPLFDLPIRIKQIHSSRGVWLVDGAFGSITCKFIPFATDISLIVSVFTLEVIAIERFSNIVYPMKRRPTINKNKVCFVLIALIWFIGAIYPALNFYKFGITYKDDTPYCLPSWEPAFNDAEAFKVEGPLLLVCFTMLPFVILTSLYSAIIVSLHRQKASLHLACRERQRRAKENRQVTYMLMTVVIVFLITWIPFNTYWFLRAFVWHSRRPCDSRHLIFTANFLMYIYPTINPFIYYVFNQNYRSGFQELLCCPTRLRSCCKTRRSISIKGNIHRATETESTTASGVVVLMSKRSIEVGQ